MLLGTPVEPVRKLWRRGPVTDQGQEGACVGFGWTNGMSASPSRTDWQNMTLPPDAPRGPERSAQTIAPWVYHHAQQLDEWPGEDYSGTSCLAGAKVARFIGRIGPYHWAESKDDVAQALSTNGPVVFSIPWYDGMYTPEGPELVVSGAQVGWHCIVGTGYDPALRLNGSTRARVRLQNSWGEGWGVAGHAWIDDERLWELVEGSGGDACVPTWL